MKFFLFVLIQCLFVASVFSMDLDSLRTVRLTLAEPCEEIIFIEEYEVITENGLTIYPNPGKGLFTLKLTGEESTGAAKLSISNLQGSIIYAEAIQLESNTHSLDLSNAHPGIYFLTLMKDGEILPLKLVIY
jgi:hypothetical protein